MTEDPETYVNVRQPRGVSWWTEWIQKSDSGRAERAAGQHVDQRRCSPSWDTFWTEKYAAEKG